MFKYLIEKSKNSTIEEGSQKENFKILATLVLFLSKNVNITFVPQINFNH